MADQDTPIPGVKTFQRLTKASVLAKDYHALYFVPDSLREIILSSAEHWDEDHIIALFDDGKVQGFTEAQWAQRQQELQDIDELIKTVSGAEEPAVFELRGDTEIPVFLEWAEAHNPGVGFNIPPAGTIVVARGGQFEFFVPAYAAAGQGRDTEAGVPSGYFDVERARIRLELFKASIPYEAGQTQLERAQQADSWIFGDSDTGSKG